MPKMTYAVLLAALCVAPTYAADKEISRPKVYSDIVACRALADNAARLSCFDLAAKGLEDAAETRQIVILDQGEVRKTKRSLFGFSLPKIPFFGVDDEEQEEEFKQIEGELTGVQSIGNGKYQFTVKDAGVWQTTEASPLLLKNGKAYSIKRGALGSYMMVMNGRGIRVKRVN
ncbi:hypothetical protein [Sphingorhabdus sp.]|uniref:hypothetical protein n=1 Tax=Sphingorhabdus sp. TaxID=1902408 RepID=UPI00391BC95F